MMSYNIKYIESEEIGPYKVCLQEFFSGKFCRYRVLIVDILGTDNPSEFFSSLYEAKKLYIKKINIIKEMMNNPKKEFILDNHAFAVLNNSYCPLVYEEMKENITITIHSWRNEQHLYYGTVVFSSDKNNGIFYDLFAIVKDINNHPGFEDFSEIMVYDPNSNITEKDKTTEILSKYGYDGSVSIDAFKKLVADAVDMFRSTTMPTPFDIRHKFITGEYNEKDLEEAVKKRWIAPERILDFIRFKAHLEICNKLKKE